LADDAEARLGGLPTHELGGDHRVVVAATRRSRMKGLAKLDRLPASTALHIPACRSVHTFTMRFPLDLVWLDRRGRPVRVDRDVPPRRLKTCLRARSVVECNAGAADGLVAAGLERLAL
jgi:uncharacterized membrane protein (UPF0127 family)